MTTYKRHGNLWTINELLSLQREYELLEWSIQDISTKHQRSVTSILFKLQQEGFILSFNDARGFLEPKFQITGVDCNDESESNEVFEYSFQNEDTISETSEINKLSERVWGLETSVGEIGTMVKQMFDSMISSKPKKRFQLRKD